MEHRNKSRRKRRVARDSPSWREFEKLVARIESALSPVGAEVRSPDRIRDRTTNELREVDASIRYRVGTTPILIIIECRFRQRLQDSQWIEQIATKQAHLGAAKCVAVSSSGFNKAATKKAEALGIEIRQLQHVEEETIQRWAPLRTWFYCYVLSNVHPSYSSGDVVELNEELDKEINDALGKKYYLEDDILRPISTGPNISLRDYIEKLINRGYSEMSNEDKLKIEIGHEYVMGYCGDPEYIVEHNRTNYNLIGVAFEVIFKQFHDYALHPLSAFDYTSGQESLVRGVEFDAIEKRGGDDAKLIVQTEAVSNRTTASVWREKSKQ